MIDKALWQQQLSQGIASPSELLRALSLPQTLLDDINVGHQLFATRVPRAFVARMQPGDINDPLLKQVLPLAIEARSAPGFSLDPLEESGANPLPGVLHKYHGRVLLIAAGTCAVNCRYCFRRHFPYADNTPAMSAWQTALDYIHADSSISEVILSGGDPLMRNDRNLQQLVNAIAGIEHVNTLRIHTRLPVVLPDRITEGLLSTLSSRLRTVMVIHANHANELDDGVARVMQRCQQAGITLLNQSVLLAGINDNAETLIDLSRRLFAIGVLPYYLHLLDKVQGVKHFDVSDDKAHALVARMQAKLPGYLVPKCVREVPGAMNKVVSHRG